MSKFKVQAMTTKTKKLKVYPLLIIVSLLLSVCSRVALAEKEVDATLGLSNDIQPSQKVLEDGRVLTRHAGDEWSRKKIKEYLTQNMLLGHYKNIRLNAGVSKEFCTGIRTDLKVLNFEFIQPGIVTDEWSDPRLDGYKKNFKEFKNAMGYREYYGPDYIRFPTWNINIYDVDIDRDGEIEVILYGERLNTKYGEQSAGGNSGYLVFEKKGKWVRGGPINGDPSRFVLDEDDYTLSGLIKIQNTYAALIIYDRSQEARAYQLEKYNEHISFSFSVSVYLLGMQDDNVRSYDSPKCVYFLGNTQHVQEMMEKEK